MGRFPAGNFRLWTGQSVNAPFVTPPVSLRLVMVLSIISVVATLVLGVLTQLGHTGGWAISDIGQAFVAAVYFVLPVLIAVAISTNRVSSRPLILIYSLAVTWQLIARLDRIIESPDTRGAALFAITLALIGITWWLYRSPRLRVYYALISDRPMPDDLAADVERLTSPGRFESAFGRAGQFIAPYLEVIVVVLVIATVLIAFGMTG